MEDLEQQNTWPQGVWTTKSDRVPYTELSIPAQLADSKPLGSACLCFPLLGIQVHAAVPGIEMDAGES